MWGGELAPLSTKMGGFVLFAIHYGRAGHRARGPKAAGPGQFGAFSFRPYCRARATGPRPQGQSLGQTLSQTLGRSSQIRGPFFYPYFGSHLISGPGHRAKGHRSRSPGQRSPGQIRGPIFLPCLWGSLSQSQFFGAVCLWWDPQPSDLSACQALSLPKLRAKKKGPI